MNDSLSQALPTEERLAVEKQKNSEAMNSSQRKFSLANKKNLWEKIVEEESVKAKQVWFCIWVKHGQT